MYRSGVIGENDSIVFSVGNVEEALRSIVEVM